MLSARVKRERRSNYYSPVLAGSSVSWLGLYNLTPRPDTKNFLTFSNKNLVQDGSNDHGARATNNYTVRYVALSCLASEIDEHRTGGGGG